jgi:hypothetical protein
MRSNDIDPIRADAASAEFVAENPFTTLERNQSRALNCRAMRARMKRKFTRY